MADDYFTLIHENLNPLKLHFDGNMNSRDKATMLKQIKEKSPVVIKQGLSV
ncbi:hypothetical protein BA6E_10299 [Bacteroidales bacterium 6E]|nr:hypothetical protein BA6E_10299 [Bacteroidales bacterium 6E]